MIEIVEFNGKRYPKFQTEGNAAQYIIPMASKVCYGIGYDIGCNRPEWAMPDSIEPKRQVVPIDPVINKWSATHLPYDHNGQVDFIFSSHCLEHLDTPWFKALEYWHLNLKTGGVLFLYLPDYSQEYWRPWNNRRHHHILTPSIMEDAFNALGMKNVFVSGIDLMNSFAIMGQKS